MPSVSYARAATLAHLLVNDGFGRSRWDLVIVQQASHVEGCVWEDIWRGGWSVWRTSNESG